MPLSDDQDKDIVCEQKRRPNFDRSPAPKALAMYARGISLKTGLGEKVKREAVALRLRLNGGPKWHLPMTRSLS